MLWTSDRPVAETSDNAQHLQETDIHDPGGIEPATAARMRPQTYVLGGANTGIGLRPTCIYEMMGWVALNPGNSALIYRQMANHHGE